MGSTFSKVHGLKNGYSYLNFITVRTQLSMYY